MLALEITSRPLEWEFKIEPARLQMRQSENPSMDMDHTPSDMKIRSRNIEVQLDGTALRASLEHRTIGDFMDQAGQKGFDGAQKAKQEAVQFGNAIAHIEDGITIGEYARQKALEQPTTYQFFIPAPYDISWKPNEQQIDYQPDELSFDWKVEESLLDFVPGSFTINILQRPEVDIKYVGKPIYVPPSSAPDFEAEA
ncbi:MAG: hypothetical protein HDT27_01340 [Subdoligranulum sp.]|nr:hypothetical protein [Subdoligranulum sp.]MBD5101341.1 hypothetical protein [Subdoligranulum sp.]